MDAPPTFSRNELARLFGVTPPYVSRLARDGVIPRPSPDRRFPVSAIAAYCSHLAAKPPGESAALKAAIAKARDGIAEQRARLLRMKADEIDGLVAPIGAVTKRWVAAALRVRQKMLAMPSKLAPLVALESSAEVVRGRVSRAVEDALLELHE